MVRAQTANMGSSPPSSNEATHYGTPSTNITAMSPEACNSANRTSAAPRFNLRVNTQAARAASRLGTNNLGMPMYGTAQLSPTAEEFTPRTATFEMRPASAGNTSQNRSPVQNLVASSIPDNTHATPHGAVGQGSKFRTVNNKAVLSPYMHVVWETFSTDENVTRTFQIFDQNIPSLHHIIGSFPLRFNSLACIDSKHIENGIIRLSFHDDRDAKQAYVLVASLTHPYCELTQLTAKDIASIHGQDSSSISNFEGQILVTILYNSRSVMPTLEQFHEKLSVFGNVKAMVTVKPNIMNSITFRVEYSNILHANAAVKHLPQTSFENVNFLAAPYEPDVRRTFNTIQPEPQVNRNFNIIQPEPQANRIAGPSRSLTGRSTVPVGDLLHHELVMARAMRESPGPSRGVARTGHNVVDIGRIEAGIDVRTTIMLRNIPNRVDQATLKELLDLTSHGDYDFMYLRIDFANNCKYVDHNTCSHSDTDLCSVGYAFINFVDPLAIVPFARARAGKRWYAGPSWDNHPRLNHFRNIFASDKVAEISYATIQGRDCLVQKFRNSSVMLEHPSYRPKLYLTRPSTRAGSEEDFPDPDNYSKMRRSIDNAEHIGLYRHRPSSRNGHQRAEPTTTHNTPARHSAPVRHFAQARRHAPAQERDTPIRSHTSTPRTWLSSTTSSSTNSGLFAPREGQAHREEQRRRRSQFDRGTPGAEIELSSYRLTDAALDAHMTNMEFDQGFDNLRM